MSESIVIEAQLEDVDLVKSLLYDTAKWLSEKGSTQWAGLLKGEDVHNIEGAIKRKEVFLVYKSDKLIGTFALWSRQTEWDRDFWGVDEAEDILYLHRLALTKDEHGNNSGSLLLDKAKEVAVSKNKKGLRLDCIASNKFLNQYYKNNGFELVGAVDQYDNGVDLKDYHLYYWNNNKIV